MEHGRFSFNVPVAIKTADCPVLSFSAGLAMSANPAHTNPWKHTVTHRKEKSVFSVR